MQNESKRTSFPRREVPPHQQIIKARNPDELQQLRNDLLHHALLHIIALQTLPNLIQQVQNIIHAIRRLAVRIEQSVEESSATVACGEARQGLALNECGDNHLGEFFLGLEHPGMVDVVLETVEIVLDDGDEALVVVPVEGPEGVLFTWANALEHVTLGNADEGEHLVDVREPEDAWDDGLLPSESLSFSFE